MTKRVGAVLLALASAACGTPAPVTAPTPVPRPATTPARPAPMPLPPIPSDTGPFRLSLVYPPPNAAIPAGLDSNFVLGSVGSAGVRLTINGAPVKTEANGAFVGWLPVPRDSAPRYDLVAVRGNDTLRASVPLRATTPVTSLPLTGKLAVDAATVTPSQSLLVRPDESVRVSLRAPANASAWLQSSGTRTPLARDGERFSVVVPGRLFVDTNATLVVGRGRDTVRLRPARVDVLSDTVHRWVTLVSHSTLPDTDQAVNARPTPGDTYRWTLMPGTVLELTGLSDDYARVRLDSSLEVFVVRDEIQMNGITTPPRRVVANARARSAPGWEDLVLPMASRPAFYVAERERSIELTLYGTRGNTDIINYPTNDTLIRHVDWVQEASDRAKYTVQLSQAPYGYLVLWEGNALVLRVRRAPQVDQARPLAGRVITLDPGHPPGGATGPTGLYEAQAALWIAQKLKPMLEQRGATVVMTRTTMDPVDLGIRPVIARRANADAFVSIHFDALPDGMNPLTVDWGTGAYFYRDHSEPLARAVKAGMTSDVALPDAGVYFRSLAVARPPWVPEILTENALIILPQQEAALRDAAFQAAMARGIADGLEAYFRSLH